MVCDLPSNAVLLRGVERGAEVCTRTRGQRALTHSFRIHSRHICVQSVICFPAPRRISLCAPIITPRRPSHPYAQRSRTRCSSGLPNLPEGARAMRAPKKTFSSLREFGRHGPNRTLARARARALSQIMQLHRWKCHVGTDPICAMQAESPRLVRIVDRFPSLPGVREYLETREPQSF